jgi:hypothetical protein
LRKPLVSGDLSSAVVDVGLQDPNLRAMYELALFPNRTETRKQIHTRDQVWVRGGGPQEPADFTTNTRETIGITCGVII